MMNMMIFDGLGAKADFIRCEDCCGLDITATGSAAHSVQLFSSSFPINKSSYYKFSLTVSCSALRYISAAVHQDGGDYTILETVGADISPQPQRIEIIFRSHSGISCVKAVLNCGSHGEALGSHKIRVHSLSFEELENYKEKEASMNEPKIIANQTGYLPESIKTAVIRGKAADNSFTIVDAERGEKVFRGALSEEFFNESAREINRLADFSQLRKCGRYIIKCGGLEDSYEFEIGQNVYRELLCDSVKWLYLQRCGVRVEDKDFGHEPCHSEMAEIYGSSEKTDVSGGWHDAGDYGRYIVPAAKAIADLLLAYRFAPELFGDDTGIDESGNGIPDILDEVRFELEWALKMQAPSGGVYHKVSCARFCAGIMPHREKERLIVSPVSLTATADFCAVMAMAWESYRSIDSVFAEKCMTAAERAWRFIEENPDLVYENPKDIHTGGYIDHSDSDERYRAACQMYRATGDSSYLAVIGRIEGEDFADGLGWYKVGHYGNIALAAMEESEGDCEFIRAARRNIIASAEGFAEECRKNGYNTAVSRLGWGSNMNIANAGIILALAYRLTDNEDYLKAAQLQLDYLLGRNPCGVCFVTGHGSISPKMPHHRPSMAMKKPVKGMLAGGVNSDLCDEVSRRLLGELPPAKRYADHFGSYSTNETVIYWNSSLTLLIALIMGRED